MQRDAGGERSGVALIGERRAGEAVGLGVALDVSVDEVQIRNLPIIVVTIPEGKDKPYAVKDKGIYIRSGASKRIATRYELDEMYSGKHSATNLFP